MTLAFLWILIAYSKLNYILESVAGKRTRLRPTHTAYLSMSYDPETRAFISTRDVESIYTEIRINRDAHRYILSSNGRWLCINNDELRRCQTATQFEIDPVVLGFQVRRGNSCLTVGERYRFEKCGKPGTEQVFVLEIDKDQICNEIETYYPDDENSRLLSDSDKKAADKRAIERTKKKLKNVSPKAMRGIEKLWGMRGFKWPSRGFC